MLKLKMSVDNRRQAADTLKRRGSNNICSVARYVHVYVLKRTHTRTHMHVHSFLTEYNRLKDVYDRIECQF